MAIKNNKRISFTVVNDLSSDQRMRRICGSLAQAGYDVVLIGRRLPQSKALPPLNFRCVRLKMLFRKGKLFYLELQLRYFFYLLFHPQDFYGAVDLDTALPNLVVARIFKRKFVYDAHEYFTEVPEVVGRPLVQKTWLWVEKLIVPRADIAYTVSQGLAELFEIKYKKKFAVVRNLPKRKSTRTAKHDPPLIVYQGALNEGRCLEFLIPAITNLPLTLWIIGEGELSGDLRNQVKTLQLEEKVIFKGFVAPEALHELTSKAFLGFNVLENKGLSYYYSLANKCFDYLQAGVPCLCSPFPEYKKLAELYPAFAFAHANEEEIRYAIQNLLNDKQAYLKMTDACLHAANQLNWESEEAVLLRLYENKD